MFWLGIILAFLAALASVGPFRTWVKSRLPTVSDSKLDLFRFVLFIIGLGISVVTHQADVRGKEQLALELRAAREIGSRENYDAATPELKEVVVEKLLRVDSIDTPSDAIVTVNIEPGDRNREFVGIELLELLSAGRIMSSRGTFVRFSESRLASAPLILCCHPSINASIRGATFKSSSTTI